MKLDVSNNKVKSDIVVCMTSWANRIENVAQVAADIWNGFAEPSKIVLTLCKGEFPYKNLPNELAHMVNDGYVELNWVNDNIKSFKRFIPYMATHPDDKMTIVTVDDDRRYSSMFLYKMITAAMTHQNYVVSADIYPVGWASLYKPEFFRDRYLWCGLSKPMCDYIVNSDMWVWANLQANRVPIYTDRSLNQETRVFDDRWALSCDCHGEYLLNVRKYIADVFRSRGVMVDLRTADERL